ncbi:Clp protease N-terminal domain-containing protein [Microbacterium sp. A84]|uniref:SRPBCC family protein n=1 Tax=Microbacterium sp. A84 TaxID=3450715 RepID=UPI003F444793
MSRFLTAAATMQTLSATAMEEASREGRREADIEHLLLALVLSEQKAGQVLRGLGITLDAARDATREQHAAQLRSLGVSIAQDEPGRITFHETEGYEWSERALGIMSRAGEGRRTGDAAAILRGLLTEPSGLIAGILQRVGTTPAAVTERLDDAERIPEHPTSSKNMVQGRFETFVPAAIAEVWALVSDAERMPEWEPQSGTVEAETADTWIVHSRTEYPDGKPAKIKESFRRRRVTRAVALEPTSVVWLIEFRDAPQAITRTLAIELSPAAGGTQVTLTSSWQRQGGWRRIVGFLLRSLQRFFVWLQLFQTGGAISRVFR